MKTTCALIAASIAALCAGCANVERSRTLNSPLVPAAVTAAQVCSNCHGLDGNSVSPNFPRIAAQPAKYLASQLTQFRSHNRSDPAGFVYMWGLSRHFTDAQIEGLATYFSQQAATPNVPAQTALAQAGRPIFEKGIASANVPACSTCHGPEGHGTDTFPRLAGQHADYVVKQLMVFQSTEQRPEGAVMKTVTHSLTPQDMRAVAAYVQGLR
jgi:cytochrome c553